MPRLRHSWTVLLLLLLTGCTSGLKRPVVSAELEPDARGVQRVVVNMHSFYFEPNRIVVRAGHPVELILKNRAKLIPHNFTIADSSLAISEGAWLGTGHLRFTPKTPGSYAFFCHVDHHANKGMTGTLVVLP
ncbi:MAG: cupredoxin domain-containing protein [Candidatus Eisenbacteria bacterium]